MPDPSSPARLAPQPIATGQISVVIPVCNGLADTARCLESLAACRPFEVIVVDNGSTDGSAEWLAEQARVVRWLRPLRLPANRGFGGGCNEGLRQARGELLVVLNNDTVVPAGLLDRLLTAWRRSPRAGLVGPVSDYVKGRQLLTLPAELAADDVEGVAAWLASEYRGQTEDVDALAGLCLLAHRSFFEEVGLFDEAYGLGNFEDDDLCLRARRAGWRLLVAHDAYVHHLGNRTFRSLGLDYREEYRQRMREHEARWQRDDLFRMDQLAEQGAWSQLLGVAGAAAAQGHVWAHCHLARALEQHDRPAEAATAWQVFLRHHPRHTQGCCHLAFDLLAAGEEEAGRRALASALTDCHLDPPAAASVLTRFARHAWDHGRHGEAEAHLATALALVPDFLPAVNTRAVWSIERGEWHEASACLLPYRERRDADVLTNLGIALYRQGQVEEAVAAFREGSELAGPESPAARNLAVLERSPGTH